MMFFFLFFFKIPSKCTALLVQFGCQLIPPGRPLGQSPSLSLPLACLGASPFPICLPAHWPLAVINNHTCFHGSGGAGWQAGRQASYMLRALSLVREAAGAGREGCKGEGRD